MSFFSKLNSKFEGMMKDDNGNQQQSAQQTTQRGYEQQQQQPYGYNGYPPQQQQSYVPQASYGAPQYQTPPPQVQQWGAPPAQASQYNTPPPQQQYGAPAAGIPPTPGVPQGWLALWDPAGQRWGYLDLPNNSVSWSVPLAPAFAQSAGMGGGYDSRGVGGYGGEVQGSGVQGGGYQEPAKDNSKKNMMMGAAGGLAIGAIGGMVLANAFDDDKGQQGGAGGEYNQGPPPMGAPLPEVDADGSSVSSSDREEVEEARREYEEAYEDAYGYD